MAKFDKLYFRKLIGKASRQNSPGWGFCFRCDRTWNVCKSHTTYYIKQNGWRGGCFPLCEDCWSELTPEQRLPYYHILIADWERQGAKEHSELPWFIVKRQIEQSVLKGG